MKKVLTVILAILLLPLGIIFTVVMLSYGITYEIVEEVTYKKEIAQRKSQRGLSTIFDKESK